MYKRNAQGWLKHIDFMILDVLLLQISFILGYKARHGWNLWPYTAPDYRSLAIVLVVVDILVVVLFNTMHNVMKRGPAKELSATVKHVILVLAVNSLYLFSTQAGDAYSRITLYVTAGLHLVLGYAFRLLWKPLIRRIGRGKNKSRMILVAEESSVRNVLKKASELDGFDYAGIVFSDRDGTGEKVQGVNCDAE